MLGSDARRRARRLERHEDTIKRLARLDDITFADAAPKGSAQIVVGDTTVALPLAGVIDMAAERARIAKEEAKTREEIAKVDAKLANAEFLAKAPESGERGAARALRHLHRDTGEARRRREADRGLSLDRVAAARTGYGCAFCSSASRFVGSTDTTLRPVSFQPKPSRSMVLT